MKILSKFWAVLVWIFSGKDADIVEIVSGQTLPTNNLPRAAAAEIHHQLAIAATTDVPPDSPMYVPLVPGKELEVAGRKLIFAPLNATACKQYREEIKSVSVGSVPDIEIVGKLAYASLLRNYPSITQQVVDDMIDYSNVFAVWETVINLTGLMVQAGELARRVEAQMQAGGLTT